jgi:antitoxin component YwqK of YwqJK toxin-antitoxin module
MRRASGLLLAAMACAAIAPLGCKGAEPVVVEETVEPQFRRLRLNDRKTGAIVRSWSVLIYPDGRQVKHGKDLRWYPSGARLSEAEYEDGEPAGLLKRWYPNGQLQSESTFDGMGELTPMRFWHENGSSKARGQAVLGRREGYWEHWYASGTPRERGGYIDGVRAGLWTLYHPDGSVQSVGLFEEGERVGSWRHFEPGERRERETDD